MDENQDFLNLLRKIQKNPTYSQRELAGELGFSLGKLNYCLRALKTKGLIKISNFKKNPNKINYIYVLTPKGISEKYKLTLNFMKRKMKEFDELKKELDKQNMWAVAKIKKKELNIFKKNLAEQLNNNIQFYYPKFQLSKNFRKLCILLL